MQQSVRRTMTRWASGRQSGVGGLGIRQLVVRSFLILSLCLTTLAVALFVGGSGSTDAANNITKIKHVVFIMEENRSFDEYFGTFPGADGIPMVNGKPAASTCNRDPRNYNICAYPYHDTADQNVGGSHMGADASKDINAGKMDGFVTEAEQVPGHGCFPGISRCNDGVHTDVMGYHTGTDLPNYWAYASNFVLQDHMFTSINSWSLPTHLGMVSAWSATCSSAARASSCVNNPNPALGSNQVFAWTDITYLLHKYGVSWKYYIGSGTGGNATPPIWNVLPHFSTVQWDKETGNIVPVTQLAADLKADKLPSVSWIMPSMLNSDHPAALVSTAQSYVTGLINQIMQSPAWSSTAIFVAWDDWGGFYDHVNPPAVDNNGYGMRVPAFLVSPYAKKGRIDHQNLSFDAYLKFIEDDFLNGARLDPKTDGRPDPRPDVRENDPKLGNLVSEFDFTQAPRAPMVLPTSPKTTLVAPPKAAAKGIQTQRWTAATPAGAG